MRMTHGGLRQHQKGFALIEALLSLVILGGLFLVFAQYQQSTNQTLKSKRAAETTANFTEIATLYLKDNAPALEAAMTDGTGAASLCVINANPATGVGTTANNVALHTCAVDVSFMKFKKLVPANYGETNGYGQKLTAIYRLVYEDFDNNPSSPPNSNGAVEMMIVGATNGGLERSATASEAVETATLMGYNGGFIPKGEWGACHYDGTGKEACSQGGGWKVDLAKFLDTP